jgi:hypothetical protein
MEHVHRGLGGLIQCNVHGIGREPKNVTVFNVEVLAGKEADAVNAGPDSVDPEVAQNHNVTWAGLDHDAIGAADQD